MTRNKELKIVIKQTIANVRNYDFIHRDIYPASGLKIEYHDRASYEYTTVNDLFIEPPGVLHSKPHIYISKRSFTNAFAVSVTMLGS